MLNKQNVCKIFSAENVCTIIIILFSSFFVCYQITDGDIFWHLAAGREIIEKKTFLFTDPFSYSLPDREWIDVHWLFQIVVYVIVKLTGEIGLIIGSSLLFGLTVGILYKSIKGSKNYLIFLPVLIIITWEIRYLNPIRPTMVTLLMMALYISILESVIRKNSLKLLYILPFLQIVWANCQGLFLIGPALFLIYFFGESINNFLSKKYSHIFIYNNCKLTDMKYWLNLFIILIAVNIISPYGLKNINFAKSLFLRIIPANNNIYSLTIDENFPLLKFFNLQNINYSVYLFCILFLSGILTALTIKKVRVSHLLMIIIFAGLSLMAKRNLILLFCIMIPALKWQFNSLDLTLKRQKIIESITVILLLPVVFELIIAHSKYVKMVFTGFSVAPFSFPEKSCEIVKRIKIKGNIFNADRYGGYLIWKNYPQKKVFIDTRLTMRPKQFFLDYLRLLDSPEKFDDFTKLNHISNVIIPISNVNYYIKLGNYLYYDSQWKLIYADGSEMLFVKNGYTTMPAIRLDDNNRENIISEFRERFKEKKLFDEAMVNYSQMEKQITSN